MMKVWWGDQQISTDCFYSILASYICFFLITINKQQLNGIHVCLQTNIMTIQLNNKSQLLLVTRWWMFITNHTFHLLFIKGFGSKGYCGVLRWAQKFIHNCESGVFNLHKFNAHTFIKSKSWIIFAVFIRSLRNCARYSIRAKSSLCPISERT